VGAGLLGGLTDVLVALEACREVLGLDVVGVATFFGCSSDFAGVAGCGRDSTGALGIDASLPASANGVAELLPFVLVSATFASAFTDVALAFDCVAGLSVNRSSTNAPPITTAVITANTMPK
jgi:hypothetical protein